MSEKPWDRPAPSREVNKARAIITPCPKCVGKPGDGSCLACGALGYKPDWMEIDRLKEAGGGTITPCFDCSGAGTRRDPNRKVNVRCWNCAGAGLVYRDDQPAGFKVNDFRTAIRSNLDTQREAEEKRRKQQEAAARKQQNAETERLRLRREQNRRVSTPDATVTIQDSRFYLDNPGLPSTPDEQVMRASDPNRSGKAWVRRNGQVMTPEEEMRYRARYSGTDEDPEGLLPPIPQARRDELAKAAKAKPFVEEEIMPSRRRVIELEED
jgi:hypothetical protein